MIETSTQLRTPPPLLLASTICFWGWQCSFLPLAIVMAILLEAAILVDWRWQITDKEFFTLSDFSGVLFFIVVIYIFSNEGAKGIYVILSTTPFILFPLLLIQKYSEQGLMKLSTLLVSLRKLDPALSPEAGKLIDLTYPYILICLLSASAGNQRTILFFYSACLLVAITLWPQRPTKKAFLSWGIALCFSFLLAFTIQHGLRKLQVSIESTIHGLFDQFMWRYRDPNRATTAIGSIGRLKLSDRIVVRLKKEEKLTQAFLLKEASYNTFGHGVWTNKHPGFRVIDQDTDSDWTLNKSDGELDTVTVSMYMTNEKGVIPLPHASTKIKNVAAIEIEKNIHETVLMDIREGWIEYDAEFQLPSLSQLPPDSNDLQILDYYREDFHSLAQELGLFDIPESEAISKIEAFFQQNFTYSLSQSQRYPRGQYLSRFLYNNRRGHCEYFATSTALLLRTIGIPSRYIVGYAVDEYSNLEGQYIARARDAHSWVHVYSDGQWRILDTTPSIWSEFDQEFASAFEPLMDVWAWISHTWARWQADDLNEQESESNYLLWLLLPLIGILLWRLYSQKRIKRKLFFNNINKTKHYNGMDSPFNDLIPLIEAAGYTRRSGETLLNWLSRTSKQELSPSLKEALRLHYRYRFDPEPSDKDLKSNLNKLVKILMSSSDKWFLTE